MTTNIPYHVFPGLKNMREYSDDEIIDMACEAFNILKIRLFSPCRTMEYYNVRNVLSNIFRYEKQYKLKRIGEILGRDHASIINSLSRHSDLFKYDPVYKENYERVTDFVLYGKEFEAKLNNKKPSENNGYEKFNHHKNRSK